MPVSNICKLGLSLAFLALGVAAARAGASPDLARGKALFVADGCYGCHGRVGQGSPMTGPALHPLPLPHDVAIAYVRRPGGVMPPYSAAILSDADLSLIVTYIEALPKTRAASDIPLLSRFAPAENRGVNRP